MNEPQTVDIAVIIPLETELEMFLEVFPSVKNESDTSNWIHHVNPGVEGITMVATHQKGMGKTHALDATATLLQRFLPKLVIGLGIGGGLTNDLLLADVAYSGDIIDILDNAKQTESVVGRRKKFAVEYSTEPYLTDDTVTTSLNYIRTQPELRDLNSSWQDECEKHCVSLEIIKSSDRDGSPAAIGRPKSLNGTLACGDVSKSSKYNSVIKGADRKVLTIDTESGGIFHRAKTQHVRALAIRGISDYADKDKSTLEKETGGKIRHLAAANACRFLFYQLKNPYFIEAIKGRHGDQGLLELSSPDTISKVMSDLSAIIKEKLVKISPELKSGRSDMRLPLPRLQSQALNDDGPIPSSTRPQTLLECLRSTNRILVSLPRNYPDRNLAWIFADELKLHDIDGRQLVPLVIDGEELRPPHITLKHLSPICFDRLDKFRDSIRRVFIIDQLYISGEKSVSRIKDAILTYESDIFIFVSDSSSNPVIEVNLSEATASAQYNVVGVSLDAISSYLKSGHDVQPGEAEVVATRLDTTFKRFGLSAHPSYFAGIGTSLMDAFINANRRSELIQLAVDGYLTLLVANESKHSLTARLSRSTREEFLRELLIDIKVEKRRFKRPDLVEYVSSFMDQRDLDINELKFITAFEEASILDFEDGFVRFSLTFVEKYLLALELSRRPQEAISYFDVTSDAFDMPTFDLYSEIGPATCVIDNITSSISDLASGAPSGPSHILMTGKIAEKAVKAMGRPDGVRNRLRTASEQLRDGKDLTPEKQEILDLNESIKNSVNRTNKATADNYTPSVSVDSVAGDLQRWLAAVVLLGSGSESLKKDHKRRIIPEIVRAGSRIVDQWVRDRLNIDFFSLKAALTNEAKIQRIREEYPHIGDLKETVDKFIDMAECSQMAEPLMLVMRLLCEAAPQPTLVKSIQSCYNTSISSCDDHISKAILGTWLVDINPKEGSSVLRGILHSMPKAHFTRMVLSMHYMSRVYWSHWQPDNRQILLDISDHVLRPIDLEIDKGQLRRMILNEDPGKPTPRRKTRDGSLVKRVTPRKISR